MDNNNQHSCVKIVARSQVMVANFDYFPNPENANYSVVINCPHMRFMVDRGFVDPDNSFGKNDLNEVEYWDIPLQ